MHVAALRAEGSAAEAPLIELAVITGVAAGFPGIYSEHALPARGFHTYMHVYTHIHTRRLTDMRARTYANRQVCISLHLFVSSVLKMHVWSCRSFDSECKMHVDILRQAY